MGRLVLIAMESDHKLDERQARIADLDSKLRTSTMARGVLSALYKHNRSRAVDLETEVNNLKDQVEDLKAVQAKAEQQAIVIKKLQERNENLNHLIQTGREKRRGTTLEDVYKLTGEGNVKRDPPPSFPELDQQLKDADDDRSEDHR